MGKVRAARAAAGRLLCDRPAETGEPCGLCRSCRLYGSRTHPDYLEIGIPAGKQLFPIDLIRQLQNEAWLKPAVAGRRVFVVKDAERMTIEAANCFLKTLEEPPGGCVFLLIASAIRDLPPTVVSRCQVVKFKAVGLAEVQQQMRQQGLDEAHSWWLACRSWASPGLAGSLLGVSLHEFNDELLRVLDGLALSENLRVSKWILEQARGRAGSRAEARLMLQEMLECAATFYRDLAVRAVAPGAVDLFNKGLEDGEKGGASEEELQRALANAESVLDAIESVAANANQPLVLDDLFTQIAARSSAR